VSPDVKGSGVGYALLRQSLLALRDMGCRAATLTVTAANEGRGAALQARGLPDCAALFGLRLGRISGIGQSNLHDQSALGRIDCADGALMNLDRALRDGEP
jgi:hypothetical protein